MTEQTVQSYEQMVALYERKVREPYMGKNDRAEAQRRLDHCREILEMARGQRADGQCDHGILSDCPHYS